MAAFMRSALFIAMAAIATATPTGSFWKGSFLDISVEEVRSLCDNDDALACIQYKMMTFVDNLFQKDSYQLSEHVSVEKNARSNEISGRGDASWEDKLANYIREHDVTFRLPVMDSKITLGARNLDEDEVDVKLQFGGSGEVEARKSKLKKILVPILVFVLLKAITLIPLALGILGLKAWNALQLSFFSFVVSVSLAVFQLCKKIAADGGHPQIAAHSPWESIGHYAARAMDVDAQQLAYSAHTQ